MAGVITQGDWPGRFGSRGLHVVGTSNPPGVPAFPFAAPGSNSKVINPNAPPGLRSYSKPDRTGHISSIMYPYYYERGDPLAININIPDNQPMRVTFGFFDYFGGNGVKQSVEFFTPGGVSLGAPITFENFDSAINYTADVPGKCVAVWKKVAGYLHGISIIGLDDPEGPPPDTVSPALVFARVDATGRQLTLEFTEEVTGRDGFRLRAQAQLPTELIFIDYADKMARFNIVRSKPIYRGETVLLDYGPGTVRDAAGNQLATFTNLQTDNTSVAPGPEWREILRAVHGTSAEGVRVGTFAEALMWPD